MNVIKTNKNFFRVIVFLMLLPVIFFLLPERRVHAYNSKAWKERLEARTAVLWVEGEFLGDDIVLNARGELNVTWLERGLSNLLTSDRNVDDWVLQSLNYYFSTDKETRAGLKGRDVFALRYRAIKSWSFEPTRLTVNGCVITAEDILTRREYWEGEAPPGYIGTVVVAGPSLKPGETAEVRYMDACAQFEVPRRAR